MSEYGINEDGFKRKDFDEIVSDIESKIKDRMGEDVDLGETSPLKSMLNTISFEIARQWDVAEHIYSSGYIDEASGANLEKIASLAGVNRQPATRSTGEITLEGDDGIEIDEGFTVSTEEGLKFETYTYEDDSATGSGVIGEDVSGELTLDVRSLDFGSETNVASGTITEFVDTKSGVYTVTNSDPTTGGEDKETDKELRLRTKRILEERGNATKRAIEQRILDKDGVETVLINEHTDEVKLDITVGGLGDFTGTDVEQELHDLMDGVRAYGVDYNLIAPTIVDMQVGDSTTNVEIVVESEYPDDWDTQIKSSIKDYINSSLSIGDNVLYAKLYDVIYNTGSWVYNVNNLTLGKVGGTINADDYPIDESASQNAEIADDNIYLTVTVKS